MDRNAEAARAGGWCSELWVELEVAAEAELLAVRATDSATSGGMSRNLSWDELAPFLRLVLSQSLMTLMTCRSKKKKKINLKTAPKALRIKGSLLEVREYFPALLYSPFFSLRARLHSAAQGCGAPHPPSLCSAEKDRKCLAVLEELVYLFISFSSCGGHKVSPR